MAFFGAIPRPAKKCSTANFSINAQGEDVVAVVCALPEPVKRLKKPRFAQGLLPNSKKFRATLEAHFKDVQDFEFTIQSGELFMLQTRNGKRTGLAAVRFAIEMEKEKLIDCGRRRFAAFLPINSTRCSRPCSIAVKAVKAKGYVIVGKVLPAGPGAASGKMYHERADRASGGTQVTRRAACCSSVRNETSPEDYARHDRGRKAF